MRAAWDFDQFVAAVARSRSIAGVLSALGYGVSGANYRRVHRLVQQYGLDTSHFRGQGWSRGTERNGLVRYELAEVLVERSTYRNIAGLKRRLIRGGVLANRCSQCGLAEWLGKPIVLELDHINGTGDDHRLENLRLLCPNCHSQTATYCGRNTARAKAKKDGCRERESNPHGVAPNTF